MKITVKNWKKYNPRKDVKSSSWFRLEHKMISESEFWSLSAEEIRAWIYILSQCSSKNTDTPILNRDHALRVCNVKWSAILSLIKKFEGNQVHTSLESDDVTRTLRGRDVDVTSTIATRRDETRRDETKTLSASFGPRPNQVLEIWNQQCAKTPGLLPAKKITPKRAAAVARLATDFTSESDWVSYFDRIGRSKFLTGKVSGRDGQDPFRADLDFVLRQEIVAKVLEGFYESRATHPSRVLKEVIIPELCSSGEAST